MRAQGRLEAVNAPACIPAGRLGHAGARGAVLLEVVLALVLFVAAAAVVSSGLNASLDSVERQRLSAHAADLAVTVMSELQIGARSAASLGPEAFEPPFDQWTWELQVTPVETDTADSSPLTRVEVIIRHKDPPLVHRLAQVARLGRPAGQSAPANAIGEF